MGLNISAERNVDEFLKFIRDFENDVLVSEEDQAILLSMVLSRSLGGVKNTLRYSKSSLTLMDVTIQMKNILLNEIKMNINVMKMKVGTEFLEYQQKFSAKCPSK